VLPCFAAFANGFQRDAGVDAEARLSRGFDVEEIGDRADEDMAVEDARVAENVHEKGIGAIGRIELHPLPIFACAGAAGGSVDFG